MLSKSFLLNGSEQGRSENLYAPERDQERE